MTALLAELRQGNTRALARAITLVENQLPGSEELVRAVYAATGRAHVVGVTGSPGTGKSTLVNALAHRYAARSPSVGVIAVDPSSPFTGGAILGDRIRMPGLEDVRGVFVRSMATRGNLGGLARTTGDVVTLMDAGGRDPIFIETVGVGQDEVEVIRVADLCIVVLVPGMGDDVQTLKAGLMEIADVFVINKSDHPGADTVERSLEALLALSHGTERPKPIVRTIASEGIGIDELVAAIDSALGNSHHREERRERHRRATEYRLRSLVEERLVERALGALGSPGFSALVDAVAAHDKDPYSAVDEILQHIRFGEES